MKKEIYICDLCKSEFDYDYHNFKVVEWGGINLIMRSKYFFLRLKKLTIEKWVKYDYANDEFGELTKISDICTECSEDIEDYILGKVK